MRDFTVRIVSSFFYLGCLPLIPGTIGSMAGVLIFLWLSPNAPVYGSVTLVFILLGFLVIGRAEELFNKKDSRCIVIDEVSGMLLSLMLVPYDLKWAVTGFLLFRLLDTLKPYPASKIQDLHGSAGVMGDDIVAGLYTNIILQFVVRCASFTVS